MGTVRSVLTVGVVVLGIPTACLMGVLAYGRALTDAQVAEGRLLTPAESRARIAESERVFAAMTPAAHLTAAQRDLADGFDRARGIGGNFAGAERHARAVPPDAPEHAATAAIVTEIARRQQAVVPAFQRAFDGALRERPDDDDPWAMRAARIRFAITVSAFSAYGMGCIHTEDAWARALRFDHEDCDRRWFERVLGASRVTGLRAFGFVEARCGNGRGRWPTGAATSLTP
jgi:hypothetical protein